MLEVISNDDRGCQSDARCYGDRTWCPWSRDERSRATPCGARCAGDLRDDVRVVVRGCHGDSCARTGARASRVSLVRNVCRAYVSRGGPPCNPSRTPRP